MRRRSRTLRRSPSRRNESMGIIRNAHKFISLLNHSPDSYLSRVKDILSRIHWVGFHGDDREKIVLKSALHGERRTVDLYKLHTDPTKLKEKPENKNKRDTKTYHERDITNEIVMLREFAELSMDLWRACEQSGLLSVMNIYSSRLRELEAYYSKTDCPECKCHAPAHKVGCSKSPWDSTRGIPRGTS